MRVMFIGDVMGRPGRRAVSCVVPKLRVERKIDFVVANAENAAGGSGVTPKVVEELFAAGCDVLTLGDHAFRNKDGIEVIESDERVLRPANLSPRAAGHGYGTFHLTGLDTEVAVIVLIGRVFLRQESDNPFVLADELVTRLSDSGAIVLVDFHAEATSEKGAMGHLLDGRAAVVVGTHTHVQTCDECILPHGTAYITDLGMTGPHNSILGCRIDRVLDHFLTDMPAKFDVAKGDAHFCGVIVDVDPRTRLATNIERINREL